jgi:hypothetical protein
LDESLEAIFEGLANGVWFFDESSAERDGVGAESLHWIPRHCSGAERVRIRDMEE